MTVFVKSLLCKQLSFTLSNSVSRRADKINLHPFSAKTYARCSPIPLEAPVIHTTLSFREPEKFEKTYHNTHKNNATLIWIKTTLFLIIITYRFAKSLM